MYLKSSCAIMAGCLFLAAQQAQAQPINLAFSNITNADIAFAGNGTFSFVEAGGEDFKITGDTGGNGSAIGLNGVIGGTFSIGTITTTGSVETAPVTGAGTLTIGTLTANVSWVDITQIGTGTTLNDGGVLNLSNISYSGANADLLQFAETPNGVATLNFTFVPAVALTTLKNTAENTSYSGTLLNQASVVPDNGTTLSLLGVALVGVAAFRRKFAL